MSFTNPEYPNLQLIEYMFRQLLVFDEKWKNIFQKIKQENEQKNRYIQPNFSVTVFPQVWGSTCTAFDICPDGSPAMGGDAMTTAYTTVVRETNTEHYGVYIGNKLCYIVDNPTDEFYEDLKNHNMASLSVAKKRY